MTEEFNVAIINSWLGRNTKLQGTFSSLHREQHVINKIYGLFYFIVAKQHIWNNLLLFKVN